MPRVSTRGTAPPSNRRGSQYAASASPRCRGFQPAVQRLPHATNAFAIFPTATYNSYTRSLPPRGAKPMADTKINQPTDPQPPRARTQTTPKTPKTIIQSNDP